MPHGFPSVIGSVGLQTAAEPPVPPLLVLVLAEPLPVEPLADDVAPELVVEVLVPLAALVEVLLRLPTDPPLPDPEDAGAELLVAVEPPKLAVLATVLPPPPQDTAMTETGNATIDARRIQDAMRASYRSRRCASEGST